MTTLTGWWLALPSRPYHRPRQPRRVAAYAGIRRCGREVANCLALHSDLLGCVQQPTICRVALALIAGRALAFMRLAEKAAGPGGFGAFALVMHSGLRIDRRPRGARLSSERLGWAWP